MLKHSDSGPPGDSPTPSFGNFPRLAEFSKNNLKKLANFCVTKVVKNAKKYSTSLCDDDRTARNHILWKNIYVYFLENSLLKMQFKKTKNLIYIAPCFMPRRRHRVAPPSWPPRQCCFFLPKDKTSM